jgi:MFS transporter, ACS family, hexuronate transporter
MDQEAGLAWSELEYGKYREFCAAAKRRQSARRALPGAPSRLAQLELVGYLVICWTFAPLFLTQVRGFTPTQMGWLMGTLGIFATLGSFVVSGLSDILAVTFFFGWAVNGAFPLFMATIPSESVSANRMTTAMALIMGAGEVFGGVLAPWLAGLAADVAGLTAAIWILMGLTIAAGVLAMGLQETAPARLRKSRDV